MLNVVMKCNVICICNVFALQISLMQILHFAVYLYLLRPVCQTGCGVRPAFYPKYVCLFMCSLLNDEACNSGFPNIVA